MNKLITSTTLSFLLLLIVSCNNNIIAPDKTKKQLLDSPSYKLLKEKNTAPCIDDLPIEILYYILTIWVGQNCATEFIWNNLIPPCEKLCGENAFGVSYNRKKDWKKLLPILRVSKTWNQLLKEILAMQAATHGGCITESINFGTLQKNGWIPDILFILAKEATNVPMKEWCKVERGGIRTLFFNDTALLSMDEYQAMEKGQFFSLIERCEFFNFIKEDYIYWMGEQLNLGNTHTFYDIGNYFKFIDQPEQEVLYWLKKAVNEQQSLYAAQELAETYKIKKDTDNFIHWKLKARELGGKHSYYDIGKYFWQQEEEAIKWYEQEVTEDKDKEAALALSGIYAKRKDTERFIQWCLKHRELGGGKGTYLTIGDYFSNQLENQEEAIKWYEKAIKEDNDPFMASWTIKKIKKSLTGIFN